jgi:hypothetical protein
MRNDSRTLSTFGLASLGETRRGDTNESGACPFIESRIVGSPTKRAPDADASAEQSSGTTAKIGVTCHLKLLRKPLEVSLPRSLRYAGG